MGGKIGARRLQHRRHSNQAGAARRSQASSPDPTMDHPAQHSANMSRETPGPFADRVRPFLD
eukprot:8120559-Alexandrium_andersonii.AAC.1